MLRACTSTPSLTAWGKGFVKIISILPPFLLLLFLRGFLGEDSKISWLLEQPNSKPANVFF